MNVDTKAWLALLQARWNALGAREQRALRLAGYAIAALLVWSIALAPALRSLGSAEAQNTQLANATERMPALQARAKALQARPLVSHQEGLAALRAATAPMGKAATTQVLGEQATLTLKQARAQDVAALLAPEAGSLSSPTEVHLQRDASSDPRWSGTLVFHLPAPKPGTP
jgi:general secretion pathway protein M